MTTVRATGPRCGQLDRYVRRKRLVEEAMALHGRSLPMPERLDYRHRLDGLPDAELYAEVDRLAQPLLDSPVWSLGGGGS